MSQREGGKAAEEFSLSGQNHLTRFGHGQHGWSSDGVADAYSTAITKPEIPLLASRPRCPHPIQHV
ncbi:hypothetical protein PSAB6_450166 [Paraburkholderia sabiae]|nr:hypothetical protein PSAB6_450166 [Paraburkholderia sabiae]